MKLHFISGLPRSGSTLLAAILRQNPRIHAGMTSPVGGILLHMLESISRRNEASVFITPQQKIDLCAGVFENYYRSIDRDVIFDTNRLWCSKMPIVSKLFPESKVICCVRDVRSIMDSVERLYRSNPFDLSGIFGFEAGGTVFSRIGALAASNGLVGFALDALKEAVTGLNRNKLLLVEYEALANAPAETISEIYRFIGEPTFDHDFNDVEYQAVDFDLLLGTPGLHTVRGQVQFVPRDTVLPPALFDRFAGDSFWRGGIDGVRVVTWDNQPAVQDIAA